MAEQNRSPAITRWGDLRNALRRRASDTVGRSPPISLPGMDAQRALVWSSEVTRENSDLALKTELRLDCVVIR